MGKEHEVRPLIRKMFLVVFRLSGNPLKSERICKRAGDIILQSETVKQYSSFILQLCVTFCGSLQIDLCFTHFIPSIRFSS